MATRMGNPERKAVAHRSAPRPMSARHAGLERVRLLLRKHPLGVALALAWLLAVIASNVYRGADGMAVSVVLLALGLVAIGMIPALRALAGASAAARAAAAAAGRPGESDSMRQELGIPRADGPAATAAPAHNVIAFDDPFVRHRARVRPLRVLAGFSAPDLLPALRSLLERAGHDMREAGDGDSVIDALRREAFDAVLIDCSGLETMRRAHLLEDRPSRTPFVVIGAAADADVDACRAAGAQACLTGLAARPLLDVLGEIAMRPTGGEPGPAITIEQGAIASRMLDELFDLSLGPDFMKLFIRECIHDAVKCIAAIERHGGNEAWDAYRQACEALRGVASNVGAVRLAECAARAMQPTDAELPRAWRAGIAALREQFEAARTALQAAAADPALDQRGSLR